MIYESHHSTEFNHLLNKIDIICPDGVPLLYSMRILGKAKSERIAGNDMILSLLSKANSEKLKVFFYGSTEDVLGKIKFRMEREFPIVSTGYLSPPFGRIDEEELDRHAKEINVFESNIVLVGLGCPKQEIWIAKMLGKINAPMFGVGGAFLLFAGIDSRAPKWIRNWGLEWFYRLIHEPQRLFKRYLITNTYFCFLFMKELIRKM